MAALLSLFLILLIGFCAGFIGSIGGGGSLISIPFLIFLGLPPQVAIATNKFALFGLSIGALSRYVQSDKILWKRTPMFILISLVSSAIGGTALISVDESYLTILVPFFMIAMLPFLFLHSSLEVQQSAIPFSRRMIGYFLFSLVMTYSAFLGAGGGSIVMYVLVYFFGMTFTESRATDFVSWTAMLVVTNILFINYGLTEYRTAIVLGIGMLMGSYIGANSALKKGDVWVKKVFTLVVIISALKLLIDL